MPAEPTEAMIEAAHAVLSDPPYLKGDKRNTRNALRAALATVPKCKHVSGALHLTEVGMARICDDCGFQDFNT